MTQVQSVAVEACWRPMEGDTAGDFHEVVDLRDGRVAVVVGDAPGYGPRAAEIADDLRAHLRREFARTDDAAEVLSRLDEVLSSRGDDLIATAAVAVVDPRTRAIEVVNAGHLPAVIADAATVAVLDAASDPPLGLDVRRQATRRMIGADAALFLYTDGLIERRGVPISESVERLVDVAHGIGGATAWASELARRATAAFGQPRDDATVVSIRVSAGNELETGNGPLPRDQVTIRMYLDPRDLRSRELQRVAADMARLAKQTIDIHVEVFDITAADGVTEDAGVLAAPTIMRVRPEPPVRVIGWYRSAHELAAALQIPLPKES